MEERARWENRSSFLLAIVGATIGLGNLWRFPYMLYSMGGGAFLLPYSLAIFFLGLPLAVMELALGQLLQAGVVNVFRKLDPRLKGLGYVSVVGAYVCVLYYNVLMAWSFRYMFLSFTNHLPWESDPQGFFDHTVLKLAPSIDHTHLLAWGNVGFYLLTWVLVWLAIRKGVKSSGWVVWVTVPLPFVVLIALFFRCILLPGADIGIKYLLKPDFKLLATRWDIWAAAAGQVFFSTGPGMGLLQALASHNPKQQSIVSTAVIMVLSDYATSLLSGFTVFSILGHMAQLKGVPLPEVVTQGPSLTFVAVPAALTKLPAPWLFSLLFFLLLVGLGIDSAFAIFEGAIVAVRDVLPDSPSENPVKFVKNHLTAIMCGTAFFIGLLFCTDGSLYFLDLFDHFVAVYLFVGMGVAEAFIVGWGYGAERLSKDITHATGSPCPRWVVFMWKYGAPLYISFAFIAQVVEEFRTPLRQTNNNLPFPAWALFLGGCVAAIPWIYALVVGVVEHRARGGGNGLIGAAGGIEDIYLGGYERVEDSLYGATNRR